MVGTFLLIGPVPFINTAPSVSLIYGMMSLAGIGYGCIVASTFARSHGAAVRLGFVDNLATNLFIFGA